jgi:hypothetical protein
LKSKTTFFYKGMLLTLASFTVEIAGLNPAEGTYVLLMFVVCCVSSPLKQADPSFKGVLLGVGVCLSVCDLGTSTIKWTRPKVSCWAKENKRKNWQA